MPRFLDSVRPERQVRPEPQGLQTLQLFRSHEHTKLVKLNNWLEGLQTMMFRSHRHKRGSRLWRGGEEARRRGGSSDAKIVAHKCPFYWVAQDDHQRKDIYVQLCFQIDWGRRRCSNSDYATFRSRVLHAHKQSDARLFTEIPKKSRPRKTASCKPMFVQIGCIEEGE